MGQRWRRSPGRIRVIPDISPAPACGMCPSPSTAERDLRREPGDTPDRSQVQPPNKQNLENRDPKAPLGPEAGPEKLGVEVISRKQQTCLGGVAETLRCPLPSS